MQAHPYKSTELRAGPVTTDSLAQTGCSTRKFEPVFGLRGRLRRSLRRLPGMRAGPPLNFDGNVRPESIPLFTSPPATVESLFAGTGISVSPLIRDEADCLVLNCIKSFTERLMAKEVGQGPSQMSEKPEHGNELGKPRRS